MFLPAADRANPSLRRNWRAPARPSYSNGLACVSSRAAGLAGVVFLPSASPASNSDMRSASASTLARNASFNLASTETRIGDRGHGKVHRKHGKAHGHV